MNIARYNRELAVALAYALVLLALAAFAPGFYRGNQLTATLVASAPVLVATIGATLVILTRQIDISIGSQFAVCGIAAGLLAKAGVPLPVVAVATVALGAMLGAVNGALVAGLGLPSVVATLATMVMLREGLRWAREGEFVRQLPAGFQWFGLSQELGGGLIVLVAVAAWVIAAWALKYVAGGRAVYATGSDPQAAFLAGIRPAQVTFNVFAVAGALTGLAALLHAVRFAAVDPFAGTGLELAAISAAVLGGVAISGGRGTLVGPLFAVLLLATIRPALVFLGAEAHWEKALQGAIILVAMAGDALKLKRRGHVQLAAA
jgi:rhamnose transport system permease protein